MELKFVAIDTKNLESFRSYLLPQVAQALARREENYLALGAVSGGYALGAAVGGLAQEHLSFVSLYVDKNARRQSVGSALVEKWLSDAQALWPDVHRVQADYTASAEDIGAVDALLVSLGFDEPRASARLFSVDTAKLHGLPMIGEAFSPGFREDGHIVPFSELSTAQTDELESDENVPSSLKPSAHRGNIMKQVSTAWLENGRVLAWVLGHQGVDGEMVMTAAYKRPEAPKGSFRKLLAASANRAYLSLGRNFIVYIATINEHSGRLVETISGGNLVEHLHHRTQMYL